MEKVSHQKKLTFFAVIAIKPVDIVFDKIIENIKEVNRNHVITQSYDCSDTINNTNDYCPLSLETGTTAVSVVSLF